MANEEHLALLKLMASRHISNVIEVTAKAESESVSEAPKKVSNYSMQNPQFGGGLVDTNAVQSQHIGGVINNNDKQEYLD